MSRAQPICIFTLISAFKHVSFVLTCSLPSQMMSASLLDCALSLWNLCRLVRKETEGLGDIHTSVVQILAVPVSCLCHWISCLDTNAFLGVLAGKQLRNCKAALSKPKIHKFGVLSANTSGFNDSEACWHVWLWQRRLCSVNGAAAADQGGKSMTQHSSEASSCWPPLPSAYSSIFPPARRRLLYFLYSKL